jgi:anti-sigma factor RsiW
VGATEATVNVVNAWRADHQDILDQLSEYLDGSLSAPEAERIQQHLDGCERCQAFYRTLGSVVSATRELPDEALPEDTRRRLIDDTLSVAT